MNGSLSSSKRTKHIKARYYFIKDRIEEGEVDMQYCPTKEMWSNVLNKPKTAPRLERIALSLWMFHWGTTVMSSNWILKPNLLRKDKSLETTEIRRSRVPSRSVLGNITNKGILRNGKNSNNGGNAVTWSEVAHGQMADGFDWSDWITSAWIFTQE